MELPEFPVDWPEPDPDELTVPSSAATPYGERVPRGAVRPRPSPLVEAGLYVRGRFGSGPAGFDPLEPDDFPEPEPDDDFEPVPDLDPDDDFEPEPDDDFPVGFPLPLPFEPSRLPRSWLARSMIPDIRPRRCFGSGGALRPSAMASSSRWRARRTKCCCPICHRFDVVQYTTRPAGNRNPQTPNSSGMTRVRVCCCCEPLGFTFCICRLW